MNDTRLNVTYRSAWPQVNAANLERYIIGSVAALSCPEPYYVANPAQEYVCTGPDGHWDGLDIYPLPHCIGEYTRSLQ